MFEVISLLGVVKNYLPHSEPGPFGLLATLQLSCQTAPDGNRYADDISYPCKIAFSQFCSWDDSF